MADTNKDFLSEVSDFFSEIVLSKTKDPVKEIEICHRRLLEEDNPWVLTYLLQLRDMLGKEGSGKEKLEEIFKQENEELRAKAKESDNMILIPGSKFLRGSYEYSKEWPVRWIELDEFFIDRYPVTNEDFIKFLNSYYSENKKIKDEGDNILIDFEYSKIKEMKEGIFTIEKGYEMHPVTGVTWYAARAYCRGRGDGYRLPTEAEWEKAARGLYGRRYPWGNEFEYKCITVESGREGTVDVETCGEGKSPYECYYMAGNVWEWCVDHYKSDYYKNCPQKNPEYSERDEDFEGLRYINKVLRGGSWYNFRGSARCAFRDRVISDGRNDGIGFRCVRTKK